MTGTDRTLLALDQGTTSTRAMIFDEQGELIASHQVGLRQFYPHPGWVEHDAEEIWQTVLTCLREVCRKSRIPLTAVSAFGLTNQRESVVVWDRETGAPIAPAICWQCRRTAPRMRELEGQGKAVHIKDITGLPLDAYFSASKIEWLLNEVPRARARAEAGELLAGTIDSYLIWRLTDRSSHTTDVSNAARTMLMSLDTCDWDDELLELFGIPRRMMPEIRESAANHGLLSYRGITRWSKAPDGHAHGGTPWLDADDVEQIFSPGLFGSESLHITGVAGDQQAALFGQHCVNPGEIKSTYGTGGFVLANTGQERIRSGHRLIETVAWNVGDGPVYALEGSVFNAGSGVQWLRDELKLIERSADCERFASQVPDTGGVCFVSAFTGLGAPYWDMDARGTLVGLTRGTQREHICRAVLEGIAYQTADVIFAINNDLKSSLGIDAGEIKVDGGSSQSDLMVQFQADLCDRNIYRPAQIDTTALGAARLAGLGAGLWASVGEIPRDPTNGVRFRPRYTAEQRTRKLSEWSRAVAAAQAWSQFEAEV